MAASTFLTALRKKNILKKREGNFDSFLLGHIRDDTTPSDQMKIDNYKKKKKKTSKHFHNNGMEEVTSK